MNAQFRRNTDPTITKLIDPGRGYALTCMRCNKHMREEATSAHVCEGEKITVQNVEFTRDASMRYRCQVCSVTVPIVLVRAHAVRHPRPSLEEEEWSDFSTVEKYFKQGIKVAAGEPKVEVRVGASVASVEKAATPSVAVQSAAGPATESQQAAVSQVVPAQSPVPPSVPQQATVVPTICPQASTVSLVPKKRPRGDVTHCLRKVRKVELSLGRIFQTFKRALFVVKFRAFRRWLKYSKK